MVARLRERGTRGRPGGTATLRRGTSDRRCPRGDLLSVPDTRDGSAKLGRVRKWLIGIGALALVAVVVIGLLQAGGDDSSASPPKSLTRAEVTAPLPGQPAPLAALHARSGELVKGGLERFDSELRALRGT